MRPNRWVGGVILVLAALVGGASIGSAQTEGVWQVYLYANEVRDIVADGEEVYAATSGGLLRLDEEGRFEQWNRRPQGLLSDSVSTVTLDPTGLVWCGTNETGISVFDPHGDRWSPFTALLEPIPGNQVQRIRFAETTDGKSALLVGAKSGYSMFVDGDLRFVCQEGVDICVLSSFDVRDLRLVGDELWLATAGGATVQFADGTWSDRSAGLGGAELTVFSQGPDLYAAGPEGVWRWDGATWVAEIEGLHSDFVPLDLAQFEDELWVAGSGTAAQRGVYRRSGGAWSRVGVTAFNGTSLARTSSGRIFAGSIDTGEWRDGLWEWNGQEWLQHRAAGPSRRATYRTLLLDSQGELWFATSQRGALPLLGHYDGTDWEIRNGGQGGALGAWTWDLLEVDGDILLAHCCCSAGSNDCALERFDPVESVFEVVEGGREAWSFDLDDQGNLWSCTTNTIDVMQTGITRVSGGQQQSVTQDNAPGLSSNQAAAVLAGDNRVWIGHFTAGVDLWDWGPNGMPFLDEPDGQETDDTWAHFVSDPPSSRIIGNDIRVIVEGADGRIWIGTASGLSIFGDGRFANIGPRFDRFQSAEILDIAPTPDGGAWIAAANDGITLMTPRPDGGFDYERFGPPDLPNPSVAALALTSDGRKLWVGTDRGLASFQPFAAEDEATQEVGAYPNPLRHGCADGVRVIGGGGVASGVVVDLAGRILHRFDDRGPNEVVWDGLIDGAPASPGLYILQLRTPRGNDSVGVAILDGECEP